MSGLPPFVVCPLRLVFHFQVRPAWIQATERVSNYVIWTI